MAAMQISNWLAAQILNAVLRGVAPSFPSTVYLALYKSDPTAADTGQELSGGGYVRQPVTFAAAALDGGMMTVKNSADFEFPIFSADMGMVTHLALRTAATGGQLLWFKAMGSDSRTYVTNDKVKVYKDSIVVRFGQ